MSGLTRYEKETIILTNEADDFYEVYTFNSASTMRQISAQDGVSGR